MKVEESAKYVISMYSIQESPSTIIPFDILIWIIKFIFNTKIKDGGSTTKKAGVHQKKSLSSIWMNELL